MPDEYGVLRRVAWRQIFPWLILFQTFRLAISPPICLLATLGVLIAPLGWLGAEWLCLTPEDRRDASFQMEVAGYSQWPMRSPELAVPGQRIWTEGCSWQRLRDDTGNLGAVYWRMTTPFVQLFRLNLPWNRWFYWLLGGLWTIGVWAFFGGAISRIAAVYLGREERVSLREAMRFAARNYRPLVFSPIFPLLGLISTAIGIAGIGFFLRWDASVIVAGLLWPLALLLGLVVVVFAIGMLFGWPLLYGTISCEEGSDAFEAFSRTYSYTFQRPLHFLFYALLAIGYGAICWLLVVFVADLVVSMTVWAAIWGAGLERWNELSDMESAGAMVGVARQLVILGNRAVGVIATGINEALFWSLAIAVYLLLRRDLDQTDFREVFVEDETQRYTLPTLPSEPT